MERLGDFNYYGQQASMSHARCSVGRRAAQVWQGGCGNRSCCSRPTTSLCMPLSENACRRYAASLARIPRIPRSTGPPFLRAPCSVGSCGVETWGWLSIDSAASGALLHQAPGHGCVCGCGCSSGVRLRPAKSGERSMGGSRRITLSTCRGNGQ